MQIAHNPETGEYLGLQNGQWQKLQVAANDAGQKLYLGPDGWLPLDTGSAANPNNPAQERGAGRSLGLGTRNVMEGIGGLVGSVTSPIANVVDRATGGSGRRFGNPGAAVADALGLPTPQNSTERVLGNVIEGASGTMPTLGAGAALQTAGRAPQIAAALSDMPMLQGLSGALGGGAMGGAREGGAGVGGQIAAGLAAGVSPLGAANLGRAGKNALGGLINPEKAQAFRAVGAVPPSLGAVSDSGAIQMLEAGLGQGLTSAGVMKRAQATGQQLFDDLVEQTAQRLARGEAVPQSLEGMGDVAVSGASRGKEAFSSAARQFENTVYAPLESLSADISNVLRFIDEEASKYSPAVAEAYRARMLKELGPILDDAQPKMTLQGAPITEAEIQAQPFLRSMVQEESPSLNVASLRNWRSGIGERMKSPGAATTNDASQAELRSLYGKASEDIEAALPSDGLAQVKDYNRWYATESNVRKDVERTFFGKKDSSATARAILAADENQLQQLRHVVGEEAFDQLRAGALREMLRGKSGFSPSVAATRFSDGRTSMQPQTRDFLFSGQEGGIKAIADALEGSRTFTNTSNTAGTYNTLQALGLGAGALASLPATATAAAIPYGLAKAVTSPNNINALIERAFNPIAVQPGNMFNAATAPVRESYEDMLRRHGVKITLGK